MPGLDGIGATRALRAAVPACKVLVVTTFGRPGYLRRALEAGASGFVVKDTPARQLADAVRRGDAGARGGGPPPGAPRPAGGAAPPAAPGEGGGGGGGGGGAGGRPPPPPPPAPGDGPDP